MKKHIQSTQPTYKLRKLTIGLTSVAFAGLTISLMNNPAQAATNNSDINSEIEQTQTEEVELAQSAKTETNNSTNSTSNVADNTAQLNTKIKNSTNNENSTAISHTPISDIKSDEKQNKNIDAKQSVSDTNNSTQQIVDNTKQSASLISSSDIKSESSNTKQNINNDNNTDIKSDTKGTDNNTNLAKLQANTELSSAELKLNKHNKTIPASELKSDKHSVENEEHKYSASDIKPAVNKSTNEQKTTSNYRGNINNLINPDDFHFNVNVPGMHIPTYTTHEGDLRFATNEEVSRLRGYSQPKINGNLLHVGHYLLLMTEDCYTRLSHWVNGKEEDGKWIPTDRDNIVFPDYNFSNLIGMHWYAFLTVQPADVKVGVDGKQTDIVSPDNNFSNNDLDPYQYSPAFSVTGSALNTEITNKLHNFVFNQADLNLVPDTDDSDKYTVTLSDTGLAHLQRVLGSDFKAEQEDYTGSLTVKQQRRLTVNFVNQDGNTVSSKDYTDFKNSAINLNLSVPNGYILPAGTELKSAYELGNSNATYNIPVLTLQSAKITFVDQTAGIDLTEFNSDGGYGTKIDFGHDINAVINSYLQDGYKLISSDFNSAKTYAENNNSNVFKVVLAHRMINVASTGKTTSDLIPDTNKHYPAGVSASDLNSGAIRTIKYYYNGNSTEFNSVRQIVKFNRTAVVDAVTGKVIYSDWQVSDPAKAEFKSVDTPAITGYTPDKTTVAELKPVVNDNVTIKVVYTANDQSANVTVYDQTANKSLSDYKISKSDKYNTAIDWNTDVADLISDLKNKGYIIVSNNVPASAVFKSDNKDNQYQITVKHRIVTVDSTDLKSEQDIIPDTKQHYPAGVSASDLNSEAKRVIKYYYAGNNTEFNSEKQIVKFKRNAVVDAVTGKVTYTDWQASNPDVTEFKSVATPSITGYTPDKTTVAELKAVPDDNIVVKVIYTANTQNADVTVYDETDKKNLSEYKISKSGKYNTAINWNTNVADLISELKNKGYLIASNNMPANTVFKSDDKDNQYQIIVKHKIVTVTASDPKSEQDIIAGTTQHYPVGVTKSDLNSDATRKIVYQYEDGKVIKTVLQSVTFSRNATVDAVTGKITYTDFKADQDYPVAISPAITGYMPDQSEIKSEKAELGKNVTVVVTYKADLETVTVIAKDEQGNVLKQYTLSGKYGSQYSTKASDFKLSSDYQLVKEPANKTGKFSTDNKPVIYIFKKVVTPTIPDTNSDKDKDKQPEPDKPHGTDTKPDEIIIPNIKDNDQSEIKSDKKIPDSKIKNNTVLILNQKKNEKGKGMKALPVTDINNRNINNNVAVKGIDKVDKISRTDFKSDEIGNTNKVISKKNIITDIKNSNKLPQTGDDDQLKWSGIGLVALALAMIGFSFKSDSKNRKRK